MMIQLAFSEIAARCQREYLAGSMFTGQCLADRIPQHQETPKPHVFVLEGVFCDVAARVGSRYWSPSPTILLSV